MNDLYIGQIVRSSAGRDKGSWMIVTQILDDNYVGVCNGKDRKISNPKRKKVKHLAQTKKIVQSVQDRLENGIKVSNAEIRSILEPYEKLTSPR